MKPTRLRYRLGYTDKWWNALVEGRSSFSFDDDRYASTVGAGRRGEGPESDTADLHQAFLSLGNHKEFPVSFKAGRQELSYGDDNPQDGKHGTFENLFPTNHKFYGYADYFSLQNLHDIRPMLTLKPSPRISLALEGHLFWLAESNDNLYTVGGAPRGGVAATPGTGYGINPGYGSFVGSEIDFIAGYALTRYAQLEAGYAHFFHGGYISKSLSAPTRGARDADWGYLQITVNF